MPTTAVHRLKGEKIIRLKAVCSLPLFVERPSYKKVTAWRRVGIKANGRTVKLEARREGRLIFTSVEAVERFVEATQ